MSYCWNCQSLNLFLLIYIFLSVWDHYIVKSIYKCICACPYPPQLKHLCFFFNFGKIIIFTGQVCFMNRFSNIPPNNINFHCSSTGTLYLCIWVQGINLWLSWPKFTILKFIHDNSNVTNCQVQYI